MSNKKSGKGKRISKKGISLSPQGFHGGLQDPTSSANAFSVGLNKQASLQKEGEFQVTQTSSFFYSPELNIMGS